MKKISDDELKKVSLDGLKFIKEICEKNNLEYYIGYGTLIGAIRHEGFIPWDDDIDIWMKRDEYEKFIEIVSKENNADWEILSIYNEDYYFPWAKLCNKGSMIVPSRFFSNLIYGISIDIFPLEPLNECDEEKVVKMLEKDNFMYRKVYKKFNPYTGGIQNNKFKYFLKKMYFKIRKKTSDNHIDFLNKIKKRSLACKEAHYYICPLSPVPTYIKSEEINKICLMNFEGEKFKVPTGYDSILKRIYGNYMELPPKSKQVTHHSFEAYWKEGK